MEGQAKQEWREERGRKELAEWQRIIGERKEGNMDAKGLKARKNVDACSGLKEIIFPKSASITRWQVERHQ